ncbi:hypothetical protein ONS95_009189 [Cadophora gregata]|uniref:uncharacterized protein n=1 Tax=Cadophora gregata TaxID=51156 RepID=UPI0026DC4670|nr:uncharacterized protein ONS95_009189 [Cadophora gregata]KAK0124209.1 hypothetical protein ONS95_009189 [Cadophora gregata]KAK0129936.1 hypothetical protein ONS96_000478 [Cadophora gregata f. sp. sojae]
MPSIFPHMRMFQFNNSKNNIKNGTLACHDSSFSSNTTITTTNDGSQASEVCDTCGCVHGISLLAHQDKLECALNQIKKLEREKPEVKIYPPSEELVLEDLSLNTIIGYHKDYVAHWALSMCWRYRARVLMLHLEIAARTGDEEGIRRAKANFEDAGDYLEESIDDLFALMGDQIERVFQATKRELSKTPAVAEKEASAVDESLMEVYTARDTTRRDSVTMDDYTKNASLLSVTAEYCSDTK